MKVGVPKETARDERRVALIPDVAGSLTGREIEVVVESGAGEGSGHPDREYEEAGARIGSADDAWGTDVVVHVALPSGEEIARLRRARS